MCESFTLGSGTWGQRIEKWLTKLCWEGRTEEIRQRSACRRRKTILIFDEDEGDRLVGFAAWRLLSKDEAIDDKRVGQITAIGVVLDRQGEGIGRQLVADCIRAICDEHGPGRLVIRADVATQNYQARNAFEKGMLFRRYRTLESGYEILIHGPVGGSPEAPNAS